MSCSIIMSNSRNSWNTQNVSYSKFVELILERLDPKEEELRTLVDVSEQINYLDLPSLRAKDASAWRRLVGVMIDICSDIADGIIPPGAAKHEYPQYRELFVELRDLLHEEANQRATDNDGAAPRRV